MRLIAICTIIAAKGAMTTARMATSGLGRSSPWPKNRPKLAIIEIAPAIVATIVMISVSRLRTCASSCAITPAISSRLRISSRPVVAATDAFSGLRQVAKELGWGE